jgi:hypothetical protein
VIPTNRLGDVQSDACAQWLVENVRSSAIGHVGGGQFLIRFDGAADAQAFSARWIGAGSRCEE